MFLSSLRHGPPNQIGKAIELVVDILAEAPPPVNFIPWTGTGAVGPFIETLPPSMPPLDIPLYLPVPESMVGALISAKRSVVVTPFFS